MASLTVEADVPQNKFPLKVVQRGESESDRRRGGVRGGEGGSLAMKRWAGGGHGCGLRSRAPIGRWEDIKGI